MLLQRAATFLTPAPLTTPDAWAIAHREYKSTAGIPGKRDPFLTAYMVPLGRRAHEALYSRVVGITGAQCGKTDTILDIIGARLDQRPAPILYVGPSKDFCREQFEPRLMDLFDQADTLSRKVQRGQRNKKLLKVVAGVPVRLAYAGSSTTLKSDPFALGAVDEYDEMMANIKGQGDPLGLAEARGDSYADFCVVVTSTPSQGVVETEIDPVNGLEMWRVGSQEQILSPIWRLWQSGTRHHFAWRCPHCNQPFIPMRKHLKWEKGATPAQARRSAYLLCPNPECGGVIEESHKAAMNAAGFMIAPGQTVEDAEADRNHPDNSTWSQWTSGLCSPLKSFGDRAERLLTAINSGEEDKIQTAVNAGFAELYTPGVGSDLPEWRSILAHRQPYRRNTAPAGVIRVVAGVDVQRRSLVYVIRGFGGRGTSWLIDYGYLYGETDKPEVWHDLTTLMTSPAGGLIIERVMIDSGFRPNKTDAGDEHRVYQWAHQNSFIAYPTKGRDILNGKPFSISKIEVETDGKLSKYSLDLVHINTDFFKGLVHSRIRTPLTDPGAFFLMEGDEPDFEDYARQLFSEKRIIEDGKPVWVSTQRDNHFFDCEVLAAAGAYMLNVQALPVGLQREFALPDAGGSSVPVHQPAPPAQPLSGQSIRDRFRSMGARARR